MAYPKCIRGAGRLLLGGESGGTLILMAVMMPLLVVTMALVVDIGRIYAVQAKAQNASDAALLGAVATLSTNDLATETVRLFNANYPRNYMGSTVGNISVAEISPGVYEATYNVTVPTTVTGLFSTDIMNLNMLSQVTRGLEDEQRKLELALVLDNTGSMAGSKIEALKAASNDLVNILFGDAEQLSNLRISVVPYDIVVNIGTGRESWIQPTSRDKYNAMITQWNKGISFNRFTDHYCGPYPYQHCWEDHWTQCPIPGCVPGPYQVCNPETGVCTWHDRNCDCTPEFVPAGCEMRSRTTCTANGLVDASDEAPTAGEQWMFRLPYENRLSENGNNDTNKWARYLAPVLFASGVKAEVQAAFDAMQVSGYTRINVGLMWGWFTLSPKWQGLWDAGKPELPAPFAARLDKVIVLMTDGRNILSGDDTRTAALCNAIKSTGIKIYTVGFGGDVNETLLRNCANTPSHYWFAPSEEDLRTAFRQIADDILYSTLRLSK